MLPIDGVPWQPPALDEYLDEPFEKIEQQVHMDAIQRLDEMTRRLEDLEQELDTMLVEFAECR